MTDTRAPHLLYVAWSYPPGRGGGSYRALATPNAFARAGWRVTVLTVARETFAHTTGGDSSLEELIDPSITVVRVPFDVPSYQFNLGIWPRWRARFPELWNAWRTRRDRRVFPEAVYGPWRYVIEAEARRIHRDSPVDLTIATANPNVDFTAALALQESDGVKYVLDYRDAWQLDVFSGRRVTAPGSEVDRWESRFAAAAHEIWFVNEPIRQWHRELYPQHADRMRVVSNGFDAELAGFSPEPRDNRTDGIVFGYIGTMSDQVPLPVLLAGWRLARERDPVIAQSRLDLYGYLGHAGVPSERWNRLIDDHRGDAVAHYGPVSKTQIATTYASLDALVLLLGTGRYVTSGKVFEYSATGLPVVSVHDPGNAASDVLRSHPAWVAVDELKSESVADALVRTAALAQEQSRDDRAAVQLWAAQFERRAQLDPRIASLQTDVA